MQKLWGKGQAMTVLLETDRSKSPVPLRAGQEDLLGPGCYIETKPWGRGGCEAGIFHPGKLGTRGKRDRNTLPRCKSRDRVASGSGHRGSSASHHDPRTCNKQPSTTGERQEQWRRSDLAQASHSGWKLSMDTKPEKGIPTPQPVPYAQGGEMAGIWSLGTKEVMLTTNPKFSSTLVWIVSTFHINGLTE